LSEIGALSVGPEYDAKFVILFREVMTHINRMVPPNTGKSTICCQHRADVLDMAAAFESGDDGDQELIRNLALFLTNFLSTHLRVVETPETTELLLNANFYLVKISVVDDREIFKICLEYWSKVRIPDLGQAKC
jgi:exportin-1